MGKTMVNPWIEVISNTVNRLINGRLDTSIVFFKDGTLKNKKDTDICILLAIGCGSPKRFSQIAYAIIR